jgi:hypothetical protein
VPIKLAPRHLGPPEVEIAACAEEEREVVSQPNLRRIVSDDVRPAEVGFVAAEDWPEIERYDVVTLHNSIRRQLSKRQSRVGPRSNDATVPVFFHAELRSREIKNGRADLGLALPRTDEVLLLDRAKEERCLRLGAEEPLCNAGHRAHSVRRSMTDRK